MMDGYEDGSSNYIYSPRRNWGKLKKELTTSNSLFLYLPLLYFDIILLPTGIKTCVRLQAIY
jgi:hypothetical protein